MIERRLEDLSHELGSVGIHGRLKRRILAESEDHLRSDPDAPARFGDPRELANAFAAELGVRASRRAAVSAFVALGVAGAVYAASVLSANRPPPDTWPLLAVLVFPLVIIAPQVSFVAGMLAFVRSLRRRRKAVLPSAELTVINNRTTLALTSGLVTMAALMTFAFALRNDMADWWVVGTLSGAVVATALLVLAGVPTVGATRLRPKIPGDAGDVFDDLGFGRTGPWRFALRVALGAGVVVWISAAVQGDPFDGAIQGTAEALACLAGFAAFCRYLGLRR